MDMQASSASFSRYIPVLFPYQSRFTSDLSPFFLSLALGKEEGIWGCKVCVWLLYTVSCIAEQGKHLLFHVPLNEDFTILGRASRAAFILEKAGKGLQVVRRTDESLHESHCLSLALLGVRHYAEILAFRGKGGRSFLLVIFIAEVGIGGINHVDAFFPIVVHGAISVYFVVFFFNGDTKVRFFV